MRGRFDSSFTAYRFTSGNFVDLAFSYPDQGHPSSPTAHPPTPRLITPTLNYSLFLGTGGEVPADTPDMGSSAISFLLVLIDLSLVLVSTNTVHKYNTRTL